MVCHCLITQVTTFLLKAIVKGGHSISPMDKQTELILLSNELVHVHVQGTKDM